MRKSFALGLALALPLAGCYVVPIDHMGKPAGGYAYAPVPTPLPAQVPGPVNLIAKLYPVNDLASATGVLLGSVTNNLNGHGTFTVNVGGETFTGEATRASPGATRGIANAGGARGNFVRCTYNMNNSTQGTGECSFSNGAKYTFHLNG